MKMFLLYLTKLFQKWLLWLFLALDVITYLLGLSNWMPQLPTQIYWTLLLPGVIAASYQVYQDALLDAVRDGTLQKTENNSSTVRPAKLSIALVEGRGYEFEILSPEKSMRSIQEEGRTSARGDVFQIAPHLVAMRRSLLTLNTRITNAGTDAVDILAINADFPRILSYLWDVEGPFVLDLENEVMQYPKRITAQESLECRICLAIEPHLSLNSAQFAVRFAEEYPDKNDLSVSLTIESIDQGRRVQQHPYKVTISLRPLREQLVQIWKNEGLRDFLDGLNTKY